MRARRAFQPTIELMPLRLAPSDTGVQVNPIDPISAMPTRSPAFLDPMAPTSMPPIGPSSGIAPILDAGSSNPPIGIGGLATRLC